MRDTAAQIGPWSVPETGECPVAETLRTLGGKHKASILHCLTLGELHFLELTRALNGISRKVLAEQLRDLIDSGLVERAQKQDARQRVGYSLTEKGLALGTILSQLYDWAEMYQPRA